MALPSEPQGPPDGVSGAALAGGSYEVIRRRLLEQVAELRTRADRLNERRKQIFGASELELLATERVRTENNCVPRDIVSIAGHLLFGFHVFLGLKSETQVGDVLALYRFGRTDKGFELSAVPLESAGGFLASEEFVKEFRDTFRFSRDARLLQLRRTEQRLLAVVQLGAALSDAKIFRWAVGAKGQVGYVDARGEQDAVLPRAHDFEWTTTGREQQVTGDHPHVSVLDEVFVETVGGDLTIKVENNTRDGLGIYREPVDDPNQTLDDAEIAYAKLGVLILLRVRPFREPGYRYLVFHTRTRAVARIDAIGQACLQLPEDHGIIFPGGYLLRTGELKRFEGDAAGLRFERMIRSPNGEDVLYVFHRPDDGTYSLLAYNLVSKEVDTPIVCQGYSLFDDGTMIIFRATSPEPTRVHPVQIWRTPFTSAEFAASAPTDGSFLAKVGNADLVRGISDAYSLCALARIERPTRATYEDLVAATKRFADAYYWLGHAEAANLAEIGTQLRKTAELVIDEFEKVEAIRKRAAEALDQAATAQRELLGTLLPQELKSLDAFMAALTALRRQRGALITLREMREMNLELVDALEAEVKEQFDAVSRACVAFLLGGEAFAPTTARIDTLVGAIEAAAKGVELVPLGTELDGVQEGLALLSEVVGALVVDDTTARTKILESISVVFAQLNRARATFQSRKQEIVARESKGEFAAQFALLGQSVSGSLALCDSPERCDVELSRLLVQLEELETRFGEVGELAAELATKREDVMEAFQARRQTLVDERQRRAQSLLSAAERILAGLARRARGFTGPDELNAFYAADPMVAKLGEIAEKLAELGDSVKAEDLRGQLKSARQDALRLLRDKTDLMEGGAEVIRLGHHRFAVNTQALELTMIAREGGLALHLTGTGFYEPVAEPSLEQARDLWAESLLSESPEVYRGEYLAGSLLLAAEQGEAGRGVGELVQASLAPGGLAAYVRAAAGERYDEGYERGVHDEDAALILEKVLGARTAAGLLRFAPRARAWACLAWSLLGADARSLLLRRARAVARLRDKLGDARAQAALGTELVELLRASLEPLAIRSSATELGVAASYLCEQLAPLELRFVTSAEAVALRDALWQTLEEQGTRRSFEDDLRALEAHPAERWALARDYLDALVSRVPEQGALRPLLEEAAALLVTERRLDRETVSAQTEVVVTGLLGQHPRIESRVLRFRLDEWLGRLASFARERVPRYRAYRQARSAVLERERARLRLDELTPKVLTSFVRNRLIDETYLPLVGANLAKQLGAVGEGKRTDLMGLLLLVSPPGYGKTTLMEYVANKLGLVFVKVNGPAIGHTVGSLDPTEAPNATARQEVEKINFAFEMGNNVMLYLDDIQHTSPELLQKFISLCDAQRRIEGTWRGKTRTYDLRGKRFCVVMAGNPYTESGARFQIPDMLANRADTYNLGEVLEGKEEQFALSYLENALTSNVVLAPLAGRDPGDVVKLIRMARGEQVPSTELAYGYSAAELGEITAVLRHLQQVQQVLLTVNREYIRSASQDDAFRTEPPFKLQGSYRNMNKVAEKVVPVMTPAEVDRLLDDHYAAESQTLTTGAEQNLLKLAELRGRLDEAQQARWSSIKEDFVRIKRMGGKGDDPVARVTGTLGGLDAQLGGIRQALGEAVILARQEAARTVAEARRQREAATEQAKRQAADSGGRPSPLGPELTSLLTRLEQAIGALARPQLTVDVRAPETPGLGELVAQQRTLLEQTLVPLVRALIEGSASRPAGRKAARGKAAVAEGDDTSSFVPAALEARLADLGRGLEALQTKLAAGVGTLPRFEVELGPQTESTLYLPAAGKDLLADGGIFVATYARAPRAGTEVALSVALPTGLPLELRGTVAFVREAALVADPQRPAGFGVRLRDVGDASRERLAAFANAREPSSP